MAQQEGNNNQDDTYTWSCCNDDQTLFILFYLFFATLSVITWNTVFSKPIRLIAVFIHEWSHAIACWFTCGQVHSIQVWHNEGGVTTYRGGCRCIIVPAGYVGCSLSAMIFVIMSGGRTSATIACGLFTCSLLVALCYSANRLLFYLCLGYSVFNLAICWVEYQWYSPLLQFLILYYGVTIGMFAIADIHEDTVLRDVKGSDAHACSAEVWHCCAPQCIGIQWAILAILFQLVGIWVAMVQMSEECTDLGWLDCINLSMNVDELSWERNWEFEGWWEQAQETVAQTMQTDNFANG
eukprot:Nitzschia sp. Nitz4//scaffold24_size164493//60174//61058//NITZ4_002321-RA/size164493-processed-gene-0.105-mRNA-1//-1//CDS//3329544093//988//frame0